jgi:hypothetical protein
VTDLGEEKKDKSSASDRSKKIEDIQCLRNELLLGGLGHR